jgi:chorismate mutase
MVGRTVVIGDIPWVAQAAEAFLSKLFACSYSIAGLNVHSANPVDHFVHRHTHRVVRGSLVVCGRPDGRLSALSTAEAAVCLSVNQASSIQSLGGTCESITIGHNPFKLPLTHDAIFLERNRPLFLCERMLTEADIAEEKAKPETNRIEVPTRTQRVWSALSEKLSSAKQAIVSRREMWASILDASIGRSQRSVHDPSIRPRVVKHRSSVALVGAYMNFDKDSSPIVPREEGHEEHISVEGVIGAAIQERKWSDHAQKLFKTLDVDKNGFIGKDEFIAGYHKLKPELTEYLLDQIFDECDLEGSGRLDFAEFLKVMRRPELESAVKLPPSVKDERGIIRVEPTKEKYFGETIRKYNAGKALKNFDFMLARNQHFSQELYEGRIASLQRFVAMTVMFHQMGSRVQAFFPCISFGMLGYRVDRTHSIMRIATTASPVSGADVRQRMRILQLQKKVFHSIHVISVAWLHYKARKESNRIVRLEKKVSSMDDGGEQSTKNLELE